MLLGWDEAGDEYAGEYHGSLLLIVAGIGLTGAANDLITLFLAAELVSIPTYPALHGPATAAGRRRRSSTSLLSVFSSGLFLFGLSYLYGLAGTTNIPGILDALAGSRSAASLEETAGRLPWTGVLLVAVVMVVAGLGFRITAVPFHFYAPDVYEGSTTPSAALLAFVPKIVGFAALLRLLGYVPILATSSPLAMGEQVPMLLWIMAAVTMTLGNILALLQDNLKRMLAYSSVAHAGYMLIGLAVVPYLASGAPGEAVGGAEAVLFYLVAYGAMTVGAFAVLHHLSSSGRPVETVDDLAGLSRTHPGISLVMALFLLSLIGIPLTAGFAGKFLLFWNAMGLSSATTDQAWLYRVLALIGAVNAAIGAWYYLRMATAMYLREAIDPLPAPRTRPVVGTIAACALVTLALGVAPNLLMRPIRHALASRTAEEQAAARGGDRNVAER
ncbi:MAG: NADH-quinone oxidoreductase subunit N [Gemmataceae bacterium]